MGVKESLLTEFTADARTTRRVLERLINVSVPGAYASSADEKR